VDLCSGELHTKGLKVKLREQPSQVLAVLLKRRGGVVTRAELRKRVWSDDTFVNFDQGLNRAINKIREAPDEEAESPRFVETLPPARVSFPRPGRRRNQPRPGTRGASAHRRRRARGACPEKGGTGASGTAELERQSADATMADSYNMLAGYAALSPCQALPRPRRRPVKLSLDNQLAEAHTSLAFVKHRHQWD
jgi:hypothetical protein